jgi:hypothetical protein
LLQQRDVGCGQLHSRLLMHSHVDIRSDLSRIAYNLVGKREKVVLELIPLEVFSIYRCQDVIYPFTIAVDTET